MASQPPDDIRPARPLRTALIIAGLAFLGGLALMAWALTRWEPARRLASGAAPVPLSAAPPGRPIVAAAPVALAEPVLAPATPGQTSAIDLRIAELEGRMARIDLRAAAAAGNAARAEGLLIAFAARRAIDRGVALGYIEGELRTHFAGSQPRAVAAIIAGSQAPVTIEGLHQGLLAIKPALSGRAAQENWWDATRRTLGSLIVIRRESSTSPAPDDRVDRALLRLNSGQVDDALAEVARLPGRDKATDWMTQARRYVEAHRALDIIEAAALTTTANPIAPAQEPLP